MIDRTGRNIDYIRISVTDRCNLRCCYCMPEEGTELISHQEILTFEEIEMICRCGVELGIKTVKLTGGEPLVRKNLPYLAKRLHGLPGIEDVTITTNGCLLGEQARELKDAGISSVNVSLDTLDREHFAGITRRDSFGLVMKGIEEAAACGLNVKLNCAVMEELTREDVLAFAAFSEEKRIPVRFIEMMPIGQGCRFHALDNEALLDILKSRYPDLKESKRIWGHGPARYYEFGNHGCAGFISAVHHKFCDRCNRVRLTSDGFLKLCLASEDGVNLRDRIRAGMDDRELTELMKQTIAQKPVSHHFEKAGFGALNMNQIGG